MQQAPPSCSPSPAPSPRTKLECSPRHPGPAFRQPGPATPPSLPISLFSLALSLPFTFHHSLPPPLYPTARLSLQAYRLHMLHMLLEYVT